MKRRTWSSRTTAALVCGIAAMAVAGAALVARAGLPRQEGAPAAVASTRDASRAVDAPISTTPTTARGINPHTGRPDPDSGVELLGQPAPAWTFDRWVRGGPLTPRGLHGKVVLLRWWTDGCHFCRATLPVLEALRREHPRELVVIGVYHPKPPRAVSDREVLRLARELGFGGPIALDRDWRTLERYWLDADPERNWTSVSFLIDRQGDIRWVHGGGEYHPTSEAAHARCDVQYRELLEALDAALAAAPVGSRHTGR